MKIGYSKESVVGDIKCIENVTVDIEDRVELLYDVDKGFKNLNSLVSEIKDSLGSDGDKHESNL